MLFLISDIAYPLFCWPLQAGPVSATATGIFLLFYVSTFLHGCVFLFFIAVIRLHLSLSPFYPESMSLSSGISGCLRKPGGMIPLSASVQGCGTLF